MPALPACPPVPLASRVTYRDAVEAHTPILRLADVADLGSLPAAIRDRAGAVELPWRVTRDGVIEGAAISSIVRARIPMLGCALPNGSGRIRIHALHAPTPTQAAASATVPDAHVEPGDTLSLTVAIGAVRIERQVTALQPARAGGRLFVTDTDGRPLSVRYLQATP